jgi:hypothetical protein
MTSAALVLTILGNHHRRRRLERNQMHCAERGYKFTSDASIENVFHDASLFRNDKVRIEQLAQGEHRSVTFDVFDLSYQVTIQSNEGGSTTQAVSQTVASLPHQGVAGVRLSVVPFDGLAGAVARFLGTASSVRAVRGRGQEEGALVRWFDRHYSVTYSDESGRHQAEALMQPLLLQWLRDHGRLAFEVVDRQVLVWRPSRLVDSAARDQLVDEARQLADLLRPRWDQQLTSVTIESPAVASIQGLMLWLVVSGLASWAIAVIMLFATFFGAFALGWGRRAPVATVVVITTLTMITWVGAGLFIHRLVSRPRRPPIN